MVNNDGLISPRRRARAVNDAHVRKRDKGLMERENGLKVWFYGRLAS